VSDSFTHLHVHTEFSMLDGAARLDEMVAKAVADGMPAIGMTDHGNMYGTLDFYKECNKQGIKPIIGTEAYMAHDHRSERPTRRGRVDDSGGDTEGGKKLYYHLTLLAENQTGYKNLIQLSSLAIMEGYYYKPRMDWELLQQHSDGLIATTGCLGGHVLQSLLQGDERGALETRAIDTLASYAPGLRDSIRGVQSITPLDLEQGWGLAEGDLNHGQLILDQIFFMRPLPGWSDHRTPVDGLYLCGSGVHGGGGVSGASGRNAARVAMKVNGR
jgi:hypothetical protein